MSCRAGMQSARTLSPRILCSERSATTAAPPRPSHSCRAHPPINTGNDSVCPDTDQRGMARPQGAHCDIGAYEVQIIQFAAPGGGYQRPVRRLGGCLRFAIRPDQCYIRAGDLGRGRNIQTHHPESTVALPSNSKRRCRIRRFRWDGDCPHPAQPGDQPHHPERRH